MEIIRNIINSKKNSHINETFHIENKDVNDKEIIANKFNEFYVNIGPTLARNIPSGSCEPISYIKNGIVNYFSSFSQRKWSSDHIERYEKL